MPEPSDFKVSVVIPVFNTESYLRQCLDSVVCQTLKEIEVICVDDGSTDSSPAILAEYAAKDPRVKVITRPKTNAGAARNAGMAIATGEYLGFVDSDDWCELTLFEKAYAKAKTTGAEIVLWRYMPYNTNTARDSSSPVLPVEFRRERALLDYNFAPWNRLVKAGLVRDNAIDFQELPRFNDICFGSLVLLTAAKVDLLDEVLYHYRVGQTSNLQSNNAATPDAVIDAWHRTIDACVERGFAQESRAQLATASLNSIFYTMQTINDEAAYAGFWHRIRRLLAEDPFFGKISDEEIGNVRSAEMRRQFLESSTPMTFLVRQQKLNRESFASLWHEKTRLKKELDECWEVRRKLWNDRNRLRRKYEGEEMKKLRPDDFVSLIDDDHRFISEHAKRALIMTAIATGAKVVFDLPTKRLSGCVIERAYLEKCNGDVQAAIAGTECVIRGCKAVEALDEIESFVERWEDLVVSGHLDAIAKLLLELSVSRLSIEGEGRVLHRIGYPYFAGMIDAHARHLRCKLLLDNAYAAIAGENHFSFGTDSLRPPAPLNEPTKPRLSIVMPVFNVELYLIRAIESVRSQSCTDWELICVDDGSIDRSPEILDWYASFDRRIRVIHKENSGVSETRNLGMSAACGEYVTFLDGDDWYEPGMFREVLRAARENDLEVCFFDFQCRKFDTLAPVAHFWTFAKQAKNWPIGKVWSAVELPKWWVYGSFCQTVWKREFLIAQKAEFAPIPLGEDVSLMVRLFPFVERGYVIAKPFYNYQRGNPTSAVSRLGVEKGESFIQKWETLLDIYRNVYAKLSHECRQKFLGRMISDLCYDVSHADIVLDWLQRKGYEALELAGLEEPFVLEPVNFARIAKLLERTPVLQATDEAALAESIPSAARKIMSEIEAKRAETSKDTYLVTAQLGADNDEAIDGWSFFTYLKDRGVPAKFISWKKHKRFEEFLTVYPEDVIGLDEVAPDSYDMLEKCREILPRAKVLAQEWPVSNERLAEWFGRLEGLQFVFLQHGVTHQPPRPVHYHYWTNFNLINYCTEHERQMVEAAIGTAGRQRGAACGLCRWDLLRDEQDPEDRVLFVMFTFRPTFNIRPEVFRKSQYFRAMRRFLAEENLQRLRENGLRVVVCMHHSLQKIGETEGLFGPSVEMADTDAVSYWIRHASCLLTDFSSVSFDFWYLGKPVVYWIPDRFDEILTFPDRDKIKIGDHFLKGFVNQVHGVEAALEKIVEYANRGFAAEAEAKIARERYLGEPGDHRRRLYEAIESVERKETSK